jgi:hypothetical protein
VFVSALFFKLFFTSSIEGASVGSCMKGDPYPTVWVGNSPIAYPETAEMKVAKAENRKRGDMTSI